MSDDDVRAHERVGTVLSDKWTLERLLGIGGMAAVYAGRHRNGARAAVKVLHPSLSRHAEVRERFLREGYAANRVEHAGCVKVLDDDVVASGPDDGTAFLVMELLEGESLQDRLDRPPPVTEREFLRMAEQVLDVLAAAHSRGVVHRDLKPENLFLVRPEAGSDAAATRVKVLDFGLARLLDGQTITSHGLALGTPSFMSPEQAAGQIAQIDGRTDLFALGATGFRVRTGRRIHEGANAVELVGKMASLAAPRIRVMSPGVSAPFARVIDRALEFRREDRYPDAAAMREDVRRALDELGDEPAEPPPDALAPTVPPLPPRPEPSVSASLALDPTVNLRTPAGSATGEPAPSSSAALPVVQTHPRRRRRSWVKWTAIALATVVEVGAVALVVESRSHPSPAAPPASASASLEAPSAAPGSAPSASAGTAATASASTRPAPRPAPSSVATHAAPSPPARVGPGNVHHSSKHGTTPR